MGSQPELLAPALPLAFAQDYSTTAAFHYLVDRTGGGYSLAADLTRLQLFAEPRAFEAHSNLDVGAFWGEPDPSYGAAGAPGVWNPIALGANPVVDLSGSPTPVSAQLTSQSLGLIEANGGDLRDLLADWAQDPLGWSLQLSNLPSDGPYRVTYYAATTPIGVVESGALFANGVSHPSLPGVSFPSLVEGSSYASIETLVTGGELNLAGLSTGPATHLSGVQIERAIPLPEPGLALGAAASVLALALLARGRQLGGGREGAKSPRRGPSCQNEVSVVLKTQLETPLPIRFAPLVTSPVTVILGNKSDVVF